MPQERIKHYDVAKGLGIILVVIGHSAIEFGHYLIYMFHMPLFFFLSGVFFKREPIGVMLHKQAQRLLLPLLIFTGLIFMVALSSGDSAGISLEVPHFNGLIGPLWFLWSLFMVIIIYDITAKLVKSRTIPILVIVLLLSLVGYLADKYKLPNYIYIYSCMSVLVFYALGNLFANEMAKRIKSGRFIIYLVIAVSFSVLSMLFLLSTKIMRLSITDLHANLHANNFFVWLLGAIAGIIFIFSLSIWLDSKVAPIAKFVAIAGESSLYIFAFHMAVIRLCHKIYPYESTIIEILTITIAILIGYFIRPMLKYSFPKIFR